ncbi:MAG: hypothetical protein NT062_19375 [Proteobacteria bacterium]|nr:hypothetical protein [Pseudomonadota bacterium]
MTRRAMLGVLVLATCAKPPPAPRPPPPPPPVDLAPELAIVQPERGRFVDGEPLVVAGRARDDAAVRVTVNGAAVTTAPDGSFTTTLRLPAGLATIETHAIDATGHDVRDVRSVLVGPFASSDGARAPIAVRLGHGGLATLGQALGAAARSFDVTAAARAHNPVFENGGCLGARADVADVAIGKLEVALAARPGAIAMTIGVDDLVARFAVSYEVACLSGSTTVTVRTSALITSDLAATIRDRRVRTTLSNTRVTLDTLQLELGGVPGPIEDLLRRAITGGVEHALQTIVATRVPPIADAQLAALLAPAAVSVLGHAVTVDVVPRRFDVTTTGVTVVAEAALVVASAQGRYVARPTSLPAASPPAAADAWIAVDAIDQLLAGLWAAHAFDRTIALDELGMIGTLLKGRLHTVDVAFSLPPTLRADAGLELAIGDLILTARDAAGAELQRFAISLRSALTIGPTHALATNEPTVLVQQLGGEAGPLDAAVVELIARGVWSRAAAAVDESLAQIAVPALGPVRVRAVTGQDDFVVLDVAAELRAP